MEILFFSKLWCHCKEKRIIFLGVSYFDLCGWKKLTLQKKTHAQYNSISHLSTLIASYPFKHRLSPRKFRKDYYAINGWRRSDGILLYSLDITISLCPAYLRITLLIHIDNEEKYFKFIFSENIWETKTQTIPARIWEHIYRTPCSQDFLEHSKYENH